MKPSAPKPPVDPRPIDRLLMPFTRFLRVEASAGLLLLGCTAIALIWANSRWAEGYDHFWHTDLVVGLGAARLELSLAHFVNDGLMAIFFFVVGLEIKRELLVGELASFRQAAIPIAAAAGGMAVPALIYFGLNSSGDAARGWAIPTATDIAFAVGVVAMLGSRVPIGLKVFITAAAIVDDIGAVVVIALFYTSKISLLALAVALGAIAVSALANRLHVRTPLVYALLGLIMWVNLLESGVHATIGGVLLAFTIPSSVRIQGAGFVRFARDLVDEYERTGGNEESILSNPRRQSAVHALEQACEHVQTPLNRLEHELHPWVAYLIMPIFALANAGVALGSGFGDALGSGVGIGVALGLIAGKPLGILAGTFLAVRLGLGQLPDGTGWKHIGAAGCLCGIGFTMSLFITNLAFRDHDMLQLAKVGILCGSLVSGVVGFVLLRAAGKKEPKGES